MARCPGTSRACHLSQVCSPVLSFPSCRVVFFYKHFYSFSLAVIVPGEEKFILHWSSTGRYP